MVIKTFDVLFSYGLAGGDAAAREFTRAPPELA